MHLLEQVTAHQTRRLSGSAAVDLLALCTLRAAYIPADLTTTGADEANAWGVATTREPF